MCRHRFTTHSSCPRDRERGEFEQKTGSACTKGLASAHRFCTTVACNDPNFLHLPIMDQRVFYYPLKTDYIHSRHSRLLFCNENDPPFNLLHFPSTIKHTNPSSLLFASLQQILKQDTLVNSKSSMITVPKRSLLNSTDVLTSVVSSPPVSMLKLAKSRNGSLTFCPHVSSDI